eukprot:8573571-Pyramimonas_sp.AAC.1
MATTTMRASAVSYRWTNQTQEHIRVYSHDGPIRTSKERLRWRLESTFEALRCARHICQPS